MMIFSINLYLFPVIANKEMCLGNTGLSHIFVHVDATKQQKSMAKNERQLTSALHGGRWVEQMPHGFVARVTRGGRAEMQLQKFMALVLDSPGLVRLQ